MARNKFQIDFQASFVILFLNQCLEESGAEETSPWTGEPL
jgi:hypothetical protein